MQSAKPVGFKPPGRSQRAVSRACLATPTPHAAELAWRQAQQQWLHLAVDSPFISSSGTAVHLLGTCHHSPCNPALVHAAAKAIRPDCLAVEASDTRLSVLKRACQDPKLRDVLNRLCEGSLEDCGLVSHLSAADLAAWHAALDAALRASFCLPLSAADDAPHFAMGHPRWSEELAAAHVAGRLQVPVLAVDLPVGHPLNEQAQAFGFDGPQYEQLGLRALETETPAGEGGGDGANGHRGGDAGGGGSSCEVGRAARHAFEEWGDAAAAAAAEAGPSGRGWAPGAEERRTYVRSFVNWVLAPSALTPRQMRAFDAMDRALDPRAHAIVVGARNEFMAGRLRDVGQAQGLARVLSLGPGAGWKPPQRVLVVLGRSHVAGVRSCLEGTQMSRA